MARLTAPPNPAVPRQPNAGQATGYNAPQKINGDATAGLPDLAHLNLNDQRANPPRGQAAAAAGAQAVNPPPAPVGSTPFVNITIHANASAVTINAGPTTVHPDVALPNASQAQLFRALAPFVAPPPLTPPRRRLQGGYPVAPAPPAAAPIPAPAPVIQQPVPVPVVQPVAPVPVIQPVALVPAAYPVTPAPVIQPTVPAFHEMDEDDYGYYDEDDDSDGLPSSDTQSPPESPVIVGGDLPAAGAAPLQPPAPAANVAPVPVANVAPVPFIDFAANPGPAFVANAGPVAEDQDEYIAPRDPDHKKWYVVTVGTRVGIWREWTDMSEYVIGVPRNSHQQFRTRAEAEAHYYRKKVNGEVVVVAQ